MRAAGDLRLRPRRHWDRQYRCSNLKFLNKVATWRQKGRYQVDAVQQCPCWEQARSFRNHDIDIYLREDLISGRCSYRRLNLSCRGCSRTFTGQRRRHLGSERAKAGIRTQIASPERPNTTLSEQRGRFDVLRFSSLDARSLTP